MNDAGNRTDHRRGRGLRLARHGAGHLLPGNTTEVPGTRITVPLGLSIGRLLFRAVNTVEIVLAIALIIALLTNAPGVAGWTLLVVAAALLATQTLLLRPHLDRRAQQIITGHVPPPSRLHLIYIGLECLKVPTLMRSEPSWPPPRERAGTESPSSSTTSRDVGTREDERGHKHDRPSARSSGRSQRGQSNQ